MTAAIITLSDHERAARACLSDAAWAYFSGGAADEITLRRNQGAWQAWGLRPRVLQNLQGGHTRCTIGGTLSGMPLLVAPMAYQRWAHPDGEAGMALAAAAQACGMVLSHQTSTPLQEVASLVVDEPERGPLWFQLYWQSDAIHLHGLIQQAEAAGYEALVVTVDAPIHGIRDRELRHGMTLPEGVRAVHWNPPSPATQGVFCGGLAEQAPVWPDIETMIGMTRLPVLLKGITHPDDARRALDVGATGVIVSNHGGRVLDTLPASAELLPDVVAAVRQHSPQATVLVDGGIRRGTDLFKALALGADAALVGRPVLYALSHAGALGAAHALRLLRDEFEATLALMGCANVQHIHRDHLCMLPPQAHSTRHS